VKESKCFAITIPAVTLRAQVFECNDDLDILRMFVVKNIPGAKAALRKAEAAKTKTNKRSTARKPRPKSAKRRLRAT
jgi:hypothetical protein